jgi:Uma2 family endonuclease
MNFAENDMATPSVSVVTTADDVQGPPQGRWTYDAYAALHDDERYEIIDGVLYMAPAPGAPHQTTVGWFVFYLTTHVQIKKRGRVLPAPFDVELAPSSVVQPDVLVILNDNLGILTPSRVIGAPDLVIEVASPGTAGYDRREKQDAYALAGVREYWIADPASKTIEVLQLQDDRYRLVGVFQNGAILPSTVVPNMPVHVDQFFA